MWPCPDSRTVWLHLHPHEKSPLKHLPRPLQLKENTKMAPMAHTELCRPGIREIALSVPVLYSSDPQSPWPTSCTQGWASGRSCDRRQEHWGFGGAPTLHMMLIGTGFALRERCVQEKWSHKLRGDQFSALPLLTQLLVCQARSVLKYWHQVSSGGVQLFRFIPNSGLIYLTTWPVATSHWVLSLAFSVKLNFHCFVSAPCESAAFQGAAWSRTQELDLVILVSPFQSRISCGSVSASALRSLRSLSHKWCPSMAAPLLLAPVPSFLLGVQPM